MHDPTEKGLAALLTVLVAWKGWDVFTRFFTSGGKLLDSTAARKKILTEAETARAKLETEAAGQHEKLIIEAQNAKDARLDTKTMQLVERLEIRLDKTDAKLDHMEAKLATEEEARRVANVFADVAAERADDLQDKLKVAEADRSLLRLQIIQLNRESTERDTEGRAKEAAHEKQLAELYEMLRAANMKIIRLQNALIQARVSITLEDYPEALDAPAAVSDFLDHAEPED